MDFTITKYRQLLTALLSKGYAFQTFTDFIEKPNDKVVVMRHDVDRLPGNALKMARLEHGMGVAATYYFRAVPVSWDEGIMREIAGMGHEVGYHYENLESVVSGQRSEVGKERTEDGGQRTAFRGKREEICPRNTRKDTKKERLIDLGYEDFCRNLERFRKNFEIKTICMHGSPLSKYDNRMIWEKYDYKELGILAEPYFDVDFNEVFYITDTGRKWNN
jgi:hypothetical protein